MQKSLSDHLKTAIDQTAAVLENAQNPLILTGALDLKAAALAVQLARRVGGVLDHAASFGLRPGQEQGTMGTVPGEAFVRADVVLVAGPLKDAARADEALKRLTESREGRTVVTLGEEAADAVSGERLSLANLSLPELLGALHALTKGQKTALSETDLQNAQSFVDGRLKAAKYGVIAFDATAIDELSQFMLMALADTLSAETRWTLLAVGRPAGQPELLRMAQALTGLPPPLCFGGGKPSHDPRLWRGTNVMERGEADCLVWVSGDETAPPAWASPVKTIAISARPDAVSSASVQMQIGRAGTDHDGLMEIPATGFIASRKADATSSQPGAADILEALIERLGAGHQGAAA